MKLNDVHSKLNPCQVIKTVFPSTVSEVQQLVKNLDVSGKISVSGQLHSMGGQPYGHQTICLSNNKFNEIDEINSKSKTVMLGSGTTWDNLIPTLVRQQESSSNQISIIQKQTGADNLSIGGSLSSNIHGRNLNHRPFAHDLAGFEIVLADGSTHWCSPSENSELFELAIGGYGLFGFITKVELRLTDRVPVRRNVEIVTTNELVDYFSKRMSDGYIFGDCQLAINPENKDFLAKGIFSCYQPTDQVPSASVNRQLTPKDWDKLVLLAHTDKQKAWESYVDFYKETSGQTYWSDLHQLSTYVKDYHQRLNISRIRGLKTESSEMIMETYVPPEKLELYLEKVRSYCREKGVNIIYSTVRHIRADQISFLKWAQREYFGIILNINVVHDKTHIERAKKDIQSIIDIAIRFQGSFYLTYSAWPRADQVRACYPMLEDFLDKKLEYDPHEKFYSDWYNYIKKRVT